MKETLILSYIGSLADSYPIEGLLESINEIKDKVIIKLQFVGTISENQADLIKTTISEVEFIGQVDHQEAIQYMCKANILLCVLPLGYIYTPGKLFEYIAAKKPILCIGSKDSDAAGVLKKCGHGTTYDYNDIDGIAHFLSTMVGYDN